MNWEAITKKHYSYVKEGTFNSDCDKKNVYLCIIVVGIY